MVDIVKNVLIMLNNPPLMRLKLLKKEKFKTQQKQLMIYIYQIRYISSEERH